MRIICHIITFSVAVWLTSLFFLTKGKESPTVVETVRDVVLMDTVFVRYDRLVVTRDTVSDTVFVPIVRTRFDTVIKEVRVTGTVQGFHASIDSLSVQIPRVEQKESSKWGLSVTAGVGLTPAGLQPALTCGISYNILTL